MVYSRSKYSIEQTQKWRVAAMLALDEASEAMTCDQMRQTDMSFVGITNQKLARVLGELCEGGFAIKCKGRDGRMRYRSIKAMAENGFDVSKLVY